MSNNDKTFADTLLMEISLALAPLSQVDSPHSVFGLSRDLGWKLPATDLFKDGFTCVTGEVKTLIGNIEKIGDAIDSEDYLDLTLTVMGSVESVIRIVTEAEGLCKEIETELRALHQDFIDNSGIVTAEFPKRLLAYLVTIYLQSHWTRVYSVLHLLGILEDEERIAEHSWEPVPIGSTYIIRRIIWDQIYTIITDPMELADRVYSWNTGFLGDKFLNRLEILLRTFLIRW
jgi:hypothetical protein